MTEPTPAEAFKAEDLQDIVATMREARIFMHFITTQRRKFGPIATKAQSVGWQLANAIERAEILLPRPTAADAAKQPFETAAERYLGEALSVMKAAVRPLLDTSDYSQYPDIRKAFNDSAELAGKALDSRRARVKTSPAADAGEVRTYRDGIEAASRCADFAREHCNDGVGRDVAMKIAAAIRKLGS